MVHPIKFADVHIDGVSCAVDKLPPRINVLSMTYQFKINFIMKNTIYEICQIIVCLFYLLDYFPSSPLM